VEWDFEGKADFAVEKSPVVAAQRQGLATVSSAKNFASAAL
jgi:hypothetical protein